MKKVILMGYMASGKSVVGEEVSRLCGLKFIDLDKSIEQKLDLSIREIFSEKGEIFFRKSEREALIELLNLDQPFVLSLGGGTPCYSNNHELLKKDDVISFYLKTSIAKILERVESNNSRPLLDDKSDGQLEEYIAKHLFERSYYYNQADHIIETDDKTPSEIASEIVRLLA